MKLGKYISKIKLNKSTGKAVGYSVFCFFQNRSRHCYPISIPGKTKNTSTIVEQKTWTLFQKIKHAQDVFCKLKIVLDWLCSLNLLETANWNGSSLNV